MTYPIPLHPIEVELTHKGQDILWKCYAEDDLDATYLAQEEYPDCVVHSATLITEEDDLTPS